MTKEDKQIIERAIKENWRIGDRTRLKRLLKKNLELYRENIKLEKGNRLLGERCNQLLKDKGELTDKIADIKANCDLAIEGRDIKIMELAEQIEQMKCCENCRWLWLKKNNETVTACSSCKDKNMWRLKK